VSVFGYGLDIYMADSFNVVYIADKSNFVCIVCIKFIFFNNLYYV
jgi:hypothetical protein